MRKDYRFHGVRFYQQSLTFAEENVARLIIEKHSPPEAVLADVIDTLYKQPEAMDLFRVILKENRRYFILNWLYAKWHGVDRKNILNHLTRAEASAVLLDFFHILRTWLVDFQSIVTKSTLFQAVDKTSPTRIPNSSTSSQTAT